jgi:hypothetical protein
MSCQNKECIEDYIALVDAMTLSEDKFLEKISALQAMIDMLSMTADVLRDTIEKIADGTLTVEEIKGFVSAYKEGVRVKKGSIEVVEDSSWDSPKGEN